MAWQLNNNEPIYLQIVRKIKLQIVSKTYPPNSQLPSVRQLADEIVVNPNTVQRAMLQLEEEGLVYTQGTTGRFISPDKNLSKHLQHTLAEEYINNFLISMENLGFSQSEAIELIENYRKEV